VLGVYEALRRDVVGAGPLEPLLRTPGVTDVLVNGADRGLPRPRRGLELTPVRFPDEEAVRRLAQRLAARRRRRLDDAHAVRRPAAADGTRSTRCSRRWRGPAPHLAAGAAAAGFTLRRAGAAGS
jgi:pilus assembly protein CpaF